jgi:hypothetical protein
MCESSVASSTPMFNDEDQTYHKNFVQMSVCIDSYSLVFVLISFVMYSYSGKEHTGYGLMTHSQLVLTETQTL